MIEFNENLIRRAEKSFINRSKIVVLKIIIYAMLIFLPVIIISTFKKEATTDNVIIQGKSKATTGSEITNALIGAGIGLGITGLGVATVGAIGCVAAGSVTASIALLGGSGGQIFALGALAYDIVAMIMAPFLGIEIHLLSILTNFSLF